MCLVYPVTFGIAEFAFSSLIELALEEPPVGAQYVRYGFCSGQGGAMAAILYFQEIGVLRQRRPVSPGWGLEAI